MDMENDESVATEEQRRKLYNYFMRVVLPVGNERTSFLYVGSLLSYEALLSKVLNDPKFNGWDRKTYKAVIHFADNVDLWQEWENIYLNLEDEHAAKHAHDFYVKNRSEMDKGAELLWPEWKTDAYYKLMIKRLEDDDSFNSEYQNTPLTEESRTFKEAWLNENTYTELPEIVEIYGAVDPSMGKNKNSDTSAIILIGRAVNNYFYVLVADIKRRSPDDLIKDMQRAILQYQDKLVGFVVETNIFAEFFATTVKQKFIEAGIYINWIEQKATINKEARINAMSTNVKHGYIKFNKSHIVLWNQLKNYPKGHDDGPDAMEMALRQFISTGNGAFNFSSITLNSQNSSASRLTSIQSFINRKRW